MTGVSAVACRDELFAQASPRLPRLLLELVATPIGKLARAVAGGDA